MIIAKADEVELDGAPIDLLDEFTSIISAMHECLSERVSKEFADVAITLCGKFAFMDNNRLERMCEEIEKGLKK